MKKKGLGARGVRDKRLSEARTAQQSIDAGPKDRITFVVTPSTAERLRNYCWATGDVMGAFIEAAILDRLDAEESRRNKGKPFPERPRGGDGSGALKRGRRGGN